MLASSIGQIVSLIMYRYAKMDSDRLPYSFTDIGLITDNGRRDIFLQNYYYTADSSPDACRDYLIGFLTIGIQARRSALVNPAQLRSMSSFSQTNMHAIQKLPSEQSQFAYYAKNHSHTYPTHTGSHDITRQVEAI